MAALAPYATSHNTERKAHSNTQQPVCVRTRLSDTVQPPHGERLYALATPDPGSAAWPPTGCRDLGALSIPVELSFPSHCLQFPLDKQQSYLLALSA